MGVVLDDIRAFGTGFMIHFPETIQQANYAEWYKGNYRDLLPSPTIDNGHALYTDAERIDIPFFQLASDFIAAAVLAEPPAATAESRAGQRWLEQNESMMLRALRRGTKHWSIQDQGVWQAEPGLIQAVNPQFYYRVGQPDQHDADVGHIIAYPYRQRDLSELNVHATGLEPNRIKVIKMSQGVSTIQHFLLAGGIVGSAITGLEPAPIRAIVTAGMGDSWYGAAKPIAAALVSQFSNLEIELNRWYNRATYYSAGVGNSMREQLTNEGRGLDLRAIKVMLDKTVRPVILLQGEDIAPINEVNAPQLESVFTAVRTLLDIFFMTSGIPPSSFGIGIGRGESGYAREKAQDAASANARAYRRDLTQGLPTLVKAAGFPQSGEVSFNWSAPPFQDRTSRQQELLSLLNAGVITKEEVRKALNWGEMPQEENDGTEPPETEGQQETEAE